MAGGMRRSTATSTKNRSKTGFREKAPHGRGRKATARQTSSGNGRKR
jgi:hypothetical protein